MKKNMLALFMVFCLFQVKAQLMSWQFGSPASNGDEASYAATYVNPHITAGSLIRGSGLAASGFARGFSSADFTLNGTKTDAVNNNDYYQVSLTVQSGYTAFLYNIDVHMRRSSTAGAGSMRWKYSLNGTTFTEIGSSDITFNGTNTTDGDDQVQVMLSSISALQNLAAGTTVTLRLYLWGATTTTSTVAIGRQASGSNAPSLAVGGLVKSTSTTSLLGWQFGSPASNGDESTYASTNNATGIAVSSLTRGAGIPANGATVLARGFVAADFTLNGTKANAVSNGDYYQFVVRPISGYTVSLSSIDVRIRKSAAGANAYRWKYSLDGTNFTEIGSSDVSFVSTYDGVDQPQVDLSSIAILQDVPYGKTITFRLYAWGATTTTGTFAIGRYVSGATVNSLELQGKLTSKPSFNLGTYNLRHQKAEDVPNDTWAARYPNIASIVNKYTIDIFGVQEPSLADMSDLMPLLPNYSYIGTANEGGTSGYYSAIVYNTERFTLNQSGTFWLSTTPNSVSLGWDAAAKRVCTWGKFTDKVSGFVFYHFNTHLDHQGVVARKEGAALILRKVDTIAGSNPVAFTGDFNVDQFDSTYITVNNSAKFKNAYNLTYGSQDIYTGTFNSFDTSLHQVNRIDHAFLTTHFKASNYKVVTDKYNVSHYPSDHFPVVANIEPKQTENGELYSNFPEDFENGTTKTSYAAGNSTLKTGSWLFDNAVLQNTANDDPSSGIFAARMAGALSVSAYLQMNFNVTNGASKVVVWYSSYKASADEPCQWKLEYSTNNGSTWTQVGSTITATSKVKQQVVFLMNIQGNVRFRINKLGLGATNNGRLSIDDISIFRYDSLQVLPRQFISINAMPVMNDVSINWNIFPQPTVSHFVLWRSHNGRDFEQLSQVEAKANLYTYSFMDRVNATNSFYKLQQVGKDGSSSFSNVLFVNFGKRNDGFKVQAANKSSVAVAIQSSLAEKGNLSIVAMDGKLMYRQTISIALGSNVYSMDVQLPAGVYVLHYSSVGNNNKSVQFIIQ